jgi:2-methylisocitrate lyase-like PEP mutase family enzyme
MLRTTAQIGEATNLPVSAGLKAYYGNVAITIAQAVAVGANLEDQSRSP